MKYLLENFNNTDPAINLATEEYLVRNYDIDHDYVLLYINQPSIVIGRHQNVFEEVNLKYVTEKNIPVYRRFSGGGTVFHDPGNLNFSFITRYQKFKFNNYRYFNQPIVDFLNKLGVPARHTEGNDIMVQGKKISGSAQFTSRDRMVSHGTLLFRSDLDRLSRSLKVPGREITSRATKSRRSPVANIFDYLKESVTLETFRENLVGHLFGSQDDIPGIALKKSEQEKISDLAEKKYRQWDWTFGESPDCTIQSAVETAKGPVHCLMEISKGHIKEINFKGPGISTSEANDLRDILEGKRYYSVDVLAALEMEKSCNKNKIQWLEGLLF